MKRFQGKGIQGGAAVGRILLQIKEAPTVRVEAADAGVEKMRFEQAKAKAHRQLEELYRRALEEMGEKAAAVFEIHGLLLEDTDFNAAVCGRIEEEGVNAEYAVAVTAEHFAEQFSAMPDAYLREREADIRDISARLIENLAERDSGGADSCGTDFRGTDSDGKDSGRIDSGGADSCETNFAETDFGRILCATDLTPSQAALLDKDRILAFVTARGSLHSHAALIARSRNIPAVAGVGEELLKEIRDGDLAAVDGGTGEIFVNPDDVILSGFRKRHGEEVVERQRLQELKGMENKTLDGRSIDIYANIGGVRDMEEALANDAGGIGLFRSEFLYLESNDYPTEEEQYNVYRKVLEGMGGRKVIIRTLDIGADKRVDYFRLKEEANPALGCRGIRLCLTRPHIFKTQLRALYRASVRGNLGILFPMLTSVSELERILEICARVRLELGAENIAYSEHVDLGIMIETPAAALISDKLAPMVNFFSVGTNDLTQYTLACDRQNPEAEQFADARHEAVLRLIGMSAENAHRHGIRIGICGELGADVTLTETFLRMGIDELSVPPSMILKIREAVRSMDLSGGCSDRNEGCLQSV